MDNHLKQTPYSDPGDLGTGGLPRDPRSLTRIVRGLIVHRMEGERLGYDIPEERLHHDGESRYVREILRILRERKDAPLTEHRSCDQRFVGTCRDFSLLLCALLRATGTPARLRAGYGTYFAEGFHDDHWVTEYRAADGSWRLADAQVAAGLYDVPFDPLDVPRDRFVVAGQAWRACRAGEADPGTFGVWAEPGLRGLWLVRRNVVLDLAARHGTEPLPWDGWGLATLADGPLTGDEQALIDAVAATDDPAGLDRLHRDPRLAVPREIMSLSPFLGLRKVTLPRR
ncbi:transglutaminase-like domain-containing protein [Streptomyces sp. NPDC091215]|uniref:transglutaminase-like domain-containing protein n=1 Tax=Streptomyces sp. NPDC091215 TaxID=3155192 RepID=UPI003447F781